MGSFSTFSKKMEGTLDKLVRQNEDYAGKMTGGEYILLISSSSLEFRYFRFKSEYVCG